MGSAGRFGAVALAFACAATLLLAATGCIVRNGAAPPQRDADGRVVRAGVVETGAIRSGDCFNSGAQPVQMVTVVPCGEPHDYELFFSYDMTGGPYPGEDAIKQDWMQACMDPFQGFVGRSFDDSSLDVSAIYPTEVTWTGQQDRQVLCSVTSADGHRRQGSARGSQA